MNDQERSRAAIREARICFLASSVIKDSPDPLDALIVLLSGPLSSMHGELFDPNLLKLKVEGQFGWQISKDAIEFFIPKMRKVGWLDARNNLPSRGPYYVNLPEPEKTDYDGQDTSAALIELGDAFIKFSKQISPISALPESPLEAGTILLRNVIDANLPSNDSQKMKTDEEYLCARFIRYVAKNKLPLSQVIEQLSAVGFLLSVAEELGSPSIKRKINLNVLIDGPLILDYLKCSGKARAEATSDLFEDLKKAGASVCTFGHCVEEAREALKSVLKAHPIDRYGPTGDALRRGLVHENALISLLQGFEPAVKASGIVIYPDDIGYLPQSHQYFDNNRIRELEQIINWHGGENDNARRRDALRA